MHISLLRQLVFGGIRSAKNELALHHIECNLGGTAKEEHATATMVAGVLQRSGRIEYKRGRVQILNRKELEAAACRS